MKKRVKEIIISLFIIAIIYAISIPLWNYSNAKRNQILAINNDIDYKIDILVNKFPVLPLIEDTASTDKIEATVLSLKNQNKYEKDFELYLFVDKKSTVDTSYLRISINEVVYKTEYLESLETTDGYYYRLITGTLDAYEERPLDVRMWLSLEASNIVNQDSILITNFVTEI